MSAAKDIPAGVFLRTVHDLAGGHKNRWVMGWHVAEKFPDLPAKVVYAKFYQLKKRGLVDGCECGCRGDYCLTFKGAETIGVTVATNGMS